LILLLFRHIPASLGASRLSDFKDHDLVVVKVTHDAWLVMGDV
jgi:hypothetical protein